MSDETKNVLLSRTLIGILISLVATVAAKYGIVIDQVAWLNDIVALLGVALGVYGRVTATKTLTIT